MAEPPLNTGAKPTQTLESVVIRFAGDSGDGMQLTGTQFTNESALAGNDIATFPDYPAEIRAPAGTLAGVSGFQLHFSSSAVFTPGERPDVLVAMNPAALKVNLAALGDNAIVIVDTDAFSKGNLRKAGYAENPLEGSDLDGFRVFALPMTKLTTAALADMDLPNKTVVRCKNFFALGLCSWMFSRPTEATVEWIGTKFRRAPALVEANTRVFKAGWNYGETTEAFISNYEVKPAKIDPGHYTTVTGNMAIAWGVLAAAAKADKQLVYGSYPITPASEILHEIAAQSKTFGAVAVQAEDEIAAIGVAIGASFAGSIGVTGTSGPGVALKGEAIGLAVMTELPLVVFNVQRGGPSTGLPTKTEQADLFQALYGRNGESPVPVLAPSTPADCFEVAFEAVRIAIKHMTPVIVLSDGYIANGAQPWRIPSFDALPDVPARFWRETVGFHPYLRDEDTLARPWVELGTPGLEHRIGGIEKDYESGNISYAPENHEKMIRARASKVERIADELPAVKVNGKANGQAVVVGWGSTYGAIEESVSILNEEGFDVGHICLRWLNPLPRDLGEVLARYDTVLVPELNMGQMVRLIREQFLVDAIPVTKVQGLPFGAHELADRIRTVLEERKHEYSASA